MSERARFWRIVTGDCSDGFRCIGGGVRTQEPAIHRREAKVPAARPHDHAQRTSLRGGGFSGLSTGDVMSLQRSVGNQAVAQLLGQKASGTKLQRLAGGQGGPAPRNATPAAPLVDPVGKLSAAVTSMDFALMKSLQRTLLVEMKRDPMNPPPLVRQALATGRHLQMESIQRIRTMMTAVIGSTAGAFGAGDEAEALGMTHRESMEKIMDDQCTPWLEVLMAGHAEYRYEHFDHGVQDSVFAAVQLHSALRGLGQIGHRAAAEKESRKVSNLPEGAWCGAFAYTQAKLAGGLGSQTRAAMQGVTGIELAMTYKTDPYEKKPAWIWAFDRWMTIAAYHQARGSVRQYIKVGNGAPPDVRPGDIVIIDVEGADSGDHITTAISSDGDNLHTVGGNQGTDSAYDEKGVSDNHQKFSKNPKALNNKDKVRKSDRVFAVGRWSIVDYEQRVYHYSVQEPPKPTAGEIRAIGQAVGATA
jgi:hypothetical protein